MFAVLTDKKLLPELKNDLTLSERRREKKRDETVRVMVVEDLSNQQI